MYSFDIHQSSHEYGSRIAKQKQHDIAKHIQGTMPSTRPPSHYADPEHIRLFLNYDSLAEEAFEKEKKLKEQKAKEYALAQ